MYRYIVTNQLYTVNLSHSDNVYCCYFSQHAEDSATTTGTRGPHGKAQLGPSCRGPNGVSQLVEALKVFTDQCVLLNIKFMYGEIIALSTLCFITQEDLQRCLLHHRVTPFFNIVCALYYYSTVVTRVDAIHKWH